MKNKIIYAFLSLAMCTNGFAQKICKVCNSTIYYKSDFYTVWKIADRYPDVSKHTYGSEMNLNEKSENWFIQKYNENWESNIPKFCSQNHADIIKNKLQQREVSNDSKIRVPAKRACDYCARSIPYRNDFCYISFDRPSKVTYDSNDPLLYNDYWRETYNPIYCSKKCCYDKLSRQ